jgi:methionyl-tRNA formyltransferase
MLKKKDGQIDWKMPAEALDAFVRGMSPWPGAFTFYNNKRLKILKGRPLLVDTEASPGTVVKGFPDELRVATGRGVFSIVEIQGESGKRLPIKAFLRGHIISPGNTLT